MIIALIPTYGSRGYLDNMLQWLNNNNEVDAVELLRQDEPLGSSLARNKLIQQATAKYGYDHQYLMLDDDCVFGRDSHIRRAATIIDNEPDIGLVSFPLGGIITSGYADAIIVKHCWLINGRLLAAGANYTPGELYDCLDMSLQSYLLGYRNVITKEAFIWHDVAMAKSIRMQLVNSGKQSSNTSVPERYAKYIEVYHGYYAIKLNDVAHAEHKRNNELLIYGAHSN